MESKADTLSEMVTKKWYEENWCARLHLEQYNPDKLEDLMMSRIRKLSKEINEEHSREPMPIRTESFDEIFDSILKSGLLKVENPKVIGEQEKREAEATALDAEIAKEIDLELFVMRLENQGGWRAVSEWLHTKATKDQKQLFDRLYLSGATVPDATPQQKNLFIVRAIRTDNYRPVWVSNDSNFRTTYSEEHAVPLGRTRAENAAESLHKSGHTAVSILPV